MLKQASVGQLRRGELRREDCYLVVAMRYYPRGLRKETHHEFHCHLAPDRELFSEWKAIERTEGHEAAFVKTHYESRFRLSAPALDALNELVHRSRKENVYLVCQCELGERCHREMLLLLAQAEYGARIGMVYHTYPIFQRRLANGEAAEASPPTGH